MKATKEVTDRIPHCNECSIPLPLRIARQGEAEALWECCSCGARYKGVIAKESTKKERNHVRRICRR